MKNGEWVIGNGFGNNSNGYPLDVLSRDFYNITVQFEFDTSSLPNDIQERISIDWQYGSFSFDYSNVTEPITATFEIPFYVRFDSMMGSFNCYYSVRIYGEQ